MAMNLGKTIAPPRFLMFLVLLAAGGALLIPPLGLARGFMAAFDAAGAIFLVSLAPLLRRGEAAQMRAASQANDANRVLLLALTGLVMTVILVSVAGEIGQKPDSKMIALVIGTLVLAWLFSNIVYALHYAHLFYAHDTKGKDKGGVDFPETKEPDYWDFIYFSFTLGMTFQTSDVDITARQMRRVVTGQCLAAFVFNLGILAFTINVLGSSSG